MFKILPNYSSPHFNISGPSNSTCFLDPSLLALRINVSVLSMTEVRLLTCVELVLRLQHVLFGKICAEHANWPSDRSWASSGIWLCGGYLCVCGISFFCLSVLVISVSCQREHYFFYSRTRHSLHSKLCPSLDLYMGWMYVALMPVFSELSVL